MTSLLTEGSLSSPQRDTNLDSDYTHSVVLEPIYSNTLNQNFQSIPENYSTCLQGSDSFDNNDPTMKPTSQLNNLRSLDDEQILQFRQNDVDIID
jgi:hypothetical protein